MSFNSGSTSLHMACAFGHLGWNLQPLGGVIEEGTPPSRMIRSRLFPPLDTSTTGTALKSEAV
jgi:hypothetical protein